MWMFETASGEFKDRGIFKTEKFNGHGVESFSVQWSRTHLAGRTVL